MFLFQWLHTELCNWLRLTFTMVLSITIALWVRKNKLYFFQVTIEGSKTDKRWYIRNEVCVTSLSLTRQSWFIQLTLCPHNTNISFNNRQRMLAQLVSRSGGIPQVLSSTPRGSEFQAEGKKIPSLAPCAKALVVSRVNETGGNRSGLTGYRSNRAGSGFGRYSTGQNSKFKFKFKKWKIPKKFLKIIQGAMNLMVSNFLKNSFI